MLIQRGKFIAYASIKHKVHKKNYLTNDVELEEFVFAPMVWRHYLFGVHINFFTDHRSLHYVLSQKE